GADFAFVLNKTGRLISRDAPLEMPELGRARLMEAALAMAGIASMAEITLPRDELVPYGGGAPIDAYVPLPGPHAIVCVVMSTWADKRPVKPALDEGVRELESLVGGKSRPNKRRTTGSQKVAAAVDEKQEKPSAGSRRAERTAAKPSGAPGE